MRFNSLITLILVIYYINKSECQIHRATNQLNYQIKYDSNFTFQYLFKKLEHGNNLNRDSIGYQLINSTYVYVCNVFSLKTRNFNFFIDDLSVWITSIIGTLFLGICGILPVVILPNLADDHTKLMRSTVFKCLLSFAAGSLLGDVFIHLLPETYSSDYNSNKSNGFWTIIGVFVFFVIEKVFPDEDDEDIESEDERKNKSNMPACSDHKKFSIRDRIKHFFLHSVKVIGILNLLANIIDNFTHGIAVAGSFQASLKFGIMTLIATLLHEIPHEIGDFVILLRSGLSYKQAALAQLITAFSGIIGAMFALAYSSAEKAGDVTSWILPFTSGGFLYIVLANIIPEYLRETDFKVSLRQTLSMMFGVIVIYWFSIIFD